MGPGDGRQLEQSSGPQQVVVVNIDIPFWEVVSILVKLAIAAVPAAIVVAIFWYIIVAVLAMIGGKL